MADFARWAVAGESAMGIPPGGFIKAYWNNITGGNQAVLESSSIYEPLKKLLEGTSNGIWEGTNTDLLNSLNILAGFKDDAGTELRRTPKDWPTNARALRGKLTRIAPNLRKAGIETSDPQQTRQGRIITLSLLSSSKLRGNTVNTVNTVNGTLESSGLALTVQNPDRQHRQQQPSTEPGVPSTEMGRPSTTVNGQYAENQAFSSNVDGVDGVDGIEPKSFLADTSGKIEGAL